MYTRTRRIRGRRVYVYTMRDANALALQASWKSFAQAVCCTPRLYTCIPCCTRQAKHKCVYVGVYTLFCSMLYIIEHVRRAITVIVFGFINSTQSARGTTLRDARRWIRTVNMKLSCLVRGNGQIWSKLYGTRAWLLLLMLHQYNNQHWFCFQAGYWLGSTSFLFIFSFYRRHIWLPVKETSSNGRRMCIIYVPSLSSLITQIMRPPFSIDSERTQSKCMLCSLVVNKIITASSHDDHTEQRHHVIACTRLLGHVGVAIASCHACFCI